MTRVAREAEEFEDRQIDYWLSLGDAALSNGDNEVDKWRKKRSA